MKFLRAWERIDYVHDVKPSSRACTRPACALSSLLPGVNWGKDVDPYGSTKQALWIDLWESTPAPESGFPNDIIVALGAIRPPVRREKFQRSVMWLPIVCPLVSNPDGRA
jgi:hypothetical protein